MSERGPRDHRTLHGIGIAPGVGTGSVVRVHHRDRTGFVGATGHVVVCESLRESDVALLVLRRPAAVVLLGSVSHSVAAVLRDANIPTVTNVVLGSRERPVGGTAVVDGARGQVWHDALLVPADTARR